MSDRVKIIIEIRYQYQIDISFFIDIFSLF